MGIMARPWGPAKISSNFHALAAAVILLIVACPVPLEIDPPDLLTSLKKNFRN